MINLDSKRKVRTRALATPREWQQLAKQCFKLADLYQRMGEYNVAHRWRELSQALDPAEEN